MTKIYDTKVPIVQTRMDGYVSAWHVLLESSRAFCPQSSSVTMTCPVGQLIQRVTTRAPTVYEDLPEETAEKPADKSGIYRESAEYPGGGCHKAAGSKMNQLINKAMWFACDMSLIHIFSFLGIEVCLQGGCRRMASPTRCMHTANSDASPSGCELPYGYW